MKIEKLPSGSYRVRKMYKGERYTALFCYKPTQKEVLQALSAEMDKAKQTKERMTFYTTAERYIKNKSNLLSPATSQGYVSILKNLPKNNLFLINFSYSNVKKKGWKPLIFHVFQPLFLQNQHFLKME